MSGSYRLPPYDSPMRLIRIAQQHGHLLSDREAEFLLRFFTAILQTTNEGAIEYLKRLLDCPHEAMQTEAVEPS